MADSYDCATIPTYCLLMVWLIVMTVLQYPHLWSFDGMADSYDCATIPTYGLLTVWLIVMTVLQYPLTVF